MKNIWNYVKMLITYAEGVENSRTPRDAIFFHINFKILNFFSVLSESYMTSGQCYEGSIIPVVAPFFHSVLCSNSGMDIYWTIIAVYSTKLSNLGTAPFLIFHIELLCKCRKLYDVRQRNPHFITHSMNEQWIVFHHSVLALRLPPWHVFIYCLLSPPGKRYVVSAMTVWHQCRWEKCELLLTLSCISAPPLALQMVPCMDEWTIKTPNPKCRLFFKIYLLTDFAALYLRDFIDWRYIHRPSLWTVAPMDEGTILVYFCPSTFSLTSLPLPKVNLQYIHTVCGCGGGGCWVVL